MIPCQCFDYVRRFRPLTPILYFTMAESGNNFRNSGHAWTTPAIGNLCSIVNSKNNTSARMTLRSLFRVKNYVTFRMLNSSAIYLSASLNSPIYFQFTHIDVSVTMVYRRFRYYRILHDLLWTIMTHNRLFILHQRTNFFRVVHRSNWINVLQM